MPGAAARRTRLRAAASPLHHHRRRLHYRLCGHAWCQSQVLRRLPGDDGDEAPAAHDVELDLGQQALDLDVADDALQPVARAERLRLLAAQPLNLARRNDPSVGLVSTDADPALAVPAAERVEADPESAGRLARRVFAPSPARRNDPSVGLVSTDADPARAAPAAERVEADPESAGRLARRVFALSHARRLVHRRYLGKIKTTPSGRRRSPAVAAASPQHGLAGPVRTHARRRTPSLPWAGSGAVRP